MARNIGSRAAQASDFRRCTFYFQSEVLEMVLTNGYDRRIDLQVLPPHNKTFKTYEELYEQFLEYYDIVIDCLVTTNNIQHDVWRKHNMSLVNSFLKPDCLAKGQHIGNMGYRYNATYNIEDTGTINMVNSLYNIKKLVFEDKKYTLEELTDALINNFGFKNADEIGSFSLEAQEKRDDDDGRYDQIHADCLRSFKYGNDIPEVDGILAEFEDWYCGCGDKYESLYAKPFYVCQMSVSTHCSARCSNTCIC